MIQLTFHGAAQTVTGSKYLLETPDEKVLFDCGMFQGLKELRLRNWAPPAFDPKQVDNIVLTHAHIDHTGYLPCVVRDGFAGKILATPATVELTELLLFDAARIQEDDADYANRKGFSKHKPALPLYTTPDALAAVKRLKPTQMGDWFQASGSIWARYHDAGHLLGSTMIEVEVRRGPKPLRILFSGDVGRYDAPLYFDPSPPPQCDYLICESTYGDREHPEGDLLAGLERVVNNARKRGGVMLVASFAVGRAQQLIYLLQVLIHQKRIPEMPIFLDSPMAVDATNIYRAFRADHDLSEGDLTTDHGIFHASNVFLSHSVAESKLINQVKGPAVIISSSGMMTAGRILHHLRQRLPDKSNTVVLSGFMAAGTRGRRLKDGEPTIRIHGRDVPVKAAIDEIPGLSGHADRSDLLRWLSPLSPPRQTFLTHGEPDSAAALAETLRTERNWDVVVPQLGQTVVLEHPE